MILLCSFLGTELVSGTSLEMTKKKAAIGSNSGSGRRFCLDKVWSSIDMTVM